MEHYYSTLKRIGNQSGRMLLLVFALMISPSVIGQGISYEQWETIGGGGGDPDWAGGQANSNQASFVEGDVTPLRVPLTNLGPNKTYGIIVDFDYYQNSSNAGGRLYLDEYDTTIDGGGDPDWVLSSTLHADGTYTFTPNDPIGGDYTSPQLTFYVNNSAVDITILTYQILEDPPTGDTFRRAEIIFTTDNSFTGTTDVIIYYGLRLAFPGEAYQPVSMVLVDGAAGFTGGSLQTKIEGDAALSTTINNDPNIEYITPSNAIQLQTGVVVRGEVSGFKWSDVDGNSLWDNAEVGLGGWTLELYVDDGDGVFEPGAGDNLYSTTITSDGSIDVNGDGNPDPVGYYEFSSAAQPLTPLLPGESYFVQEENQAGFNQTYPSSPSYWGPFTITATTPTYSGSAGNAEEPNFGNQEDQCEDATADAGPDQTICEGSTVTLAGSFGGGATSATWSTAGDGTFNNVNLADAVYTPGSGDIAAGSVVLTWTTDDPEGICVGDNDSMTVTINEELVADAGDDQTICEGST
ncbi:hypothetical protein, partial [Robiginitalea aurantiaca]